MELWERQFRWQEQFHGIPLWMCQFRWYEQFHGFKWNSMELGVCQFPWDEQFHGIPWNFAPISSKQAVPWNYMEFDKTWRALISMTQVVPWNSMEFHGAWNAPISMTRAVPWNSMELYGTSTLTMKFQRLQCDSFQLTVPLLNTFMQNIEPGIHDQIWQEIWDQDTILIMRRS